MDNKNFYNVVDDFINRNFFSKTLGKTAFIDDNKSISYENLFDKIWDESNIVNKLDDQNFNNLFELHQMSKQFKFIDKQTKVIFVRNRIPRTLIKSKIKPGAALITLGGGYFSGGTDNLKRLLENLPKKLYYSDSQPSSWDWHDHNVIKL